MDEKELKPAILYYLYYELKTGLFPVDKCIAQALNFENGVEMDWFPDDKKEELELICQGISEHLLDNEKIKLSYLLEKKAPDGYFENLGSRILDKNGNSLYTISQKLLNVMEMYHDKMVSLKVAPNYKAYAMIQSVRCVDSLPFYLGGINLVKEYAIAFYCILKRMGINVIDLDDNLNPIICEEFVQALDEATEDFIEKERLYRFTLLRFYIQGLPNQYGYAPLSLDNTPEENKSRAIARNDVMKNPVFAIAIAKVVMKFNPVFKNNVGDVTDE